MSDATTESQAQPTSNQLENIKVAVRLRPFTDKEKQKSARRIVDIEQNTAILYSPKYGDTSLKKFTFDHSYWSHDGFKRDPEGVNVPDPSHPNGEKYVGQERVFEDLGQFLLSNALEGYNSALLAYGQTGSGKSYTVTGYGQNEGIVPRFARALFEELDKKAKASSESQDKHEEHEVEGGGGGDRDEGEEEARGASKETEKAGQNRYEVYFSMLEIYNEVVRDLLAKNHGHLVTQATFNRRGLKVREHPKHGFFVENLTSYACADKEEIERRIEEGQLNKSIAATSMNETSSRGHTIYEFRIKQYRLKSPENPQDETLTTSVVQLVDLAGSERLAVHVNGQLGGDSFIGSRANSPYPRSSTKASTGNGATSKPAAVSASDPQRAPTTGGSTRRARGATEAATASPVLGGNTNGAMLSNNFATTNHQQRFKESVSINQSLSALGNCIQVLSQYSQQMDSDRSSKKAPPKIPYRDSILTKLLNSCCLSGNSKVVIIATLSPAETNYDDTLSTLRFADRAKQIKTHATINRMSRSEVVDNLQRENERLKQLVDGRVTRSDDSSQTSNFDDSENVMENFAGSRIQRNRSSRAGESNDQSTGATPTRSRTTTRKSRNDRFHETRAKALRSSPKVANPSLQIKEQMKRLVSPASRKMLHENSSDESTGQGRRMVNDDESPIDGEEIDYEIDLQDLQDIKEGLISPESEEEGEEDDPITMALEEMTEEDKIKIFNKVLSNSMNVKKMNPIEFTEETLTLSKVLENKLKKMSRPKRGGSKKAASSMPLEQVSTMSSGLKKSNPFISNLNMDEQLSGVISYIIRRGESMVGKSKKCDIRLHGTGMRGKHARIIRQQAAHDKTASEVFIEPSFDDESDETSKNVALMVNGLPIKGMSKLQHGDRLLFGTNSYFVYIDHKSSAESSVDLETVTFHMAQNEVLQNMMSEEKNEAVIKEINGYSHRPGTGKHKSLRRDESRDASTRRRASRDQQQQQPGETVSASKREPELESTANNLDKRPDDANGNVADSGFKPSEEMSEEDFETLEAKYRDQLIEDTYEYFMPVGEVNAIAKEMGLKVTYSLKILTGEEQLLGQSTSQKSGSAQEPRIDSGTSDGYSSSSVVDAPTSAGGLGQSERATHISKLDALDIPPAMFIKVHLDELDIDFYWSKEKFQARRFKIMELFGCWDTGGTSALVAHLIDLTNEQDNYLFDPFIDHPNSMHVLVGHAEVTLRPIMRLTGIDQSYDILDLNDEIVGSIRIQVLPCYGDEHKSGEPYQVFSQEDLRKRLLDNPEELLDKKLVFMLKILSCNEIPDRYTHIYCQYSLQTDRPIVRTRTLREIDDSSDTPATQTHGSDLLDDSKPLMFDHTHYICIDKVTQEILDFLDYGFLTIQVVGHHKLSAKSPSVITTMITSIYSLKDKLAQQGRILTGADFLPSAFYESDSARTQRGGRARLPGTNSGASSVASTSTTANLFDQQDDEVVNGASQENVIDMILTKRKLERAENQLHYLKRTINIAEHYNKKHIPVKTVKKLLDSQGQELDSGSLEEMAADVTVKTKGTTNKNSACYII